MSKRSSRQRSVYEEEEFNTYSTSDLYEDNFDDWDGSGLATKNKRKNSGRSLPSLKDLATLTTLLEYPTAVGWAIATLFAAIMMIVTNLLNVTAFSSIIDLGLVPTWLLAVPFFAILFPFFLLLTAYQEGSSRSAIRQGVKDAFEIEFFIPNNTVMKITEIVVIIFNIMVLVSVIIAGENAAAQAFIAFMSILAPFFAYASARFLATALKIRIR